MNVSDKAQDAVVRVRNLLERFTVPCHICADTYYDGPGDWCGSCHGARHNCETAEVTMIYIVAYTLNPKRDVTPLFNELKKLGWWAHSIDDAWLIATNEKTANEVYSRVAPHFRPSDRFIIAEIAGVNSQGWLSKEIWDWVIKARDDGRA